MTRPTHDLVVFGATSFVGQILARYLSEYLSGAGETLRWAIAGRSEAKLRQVRETLGAAGQSVPIIVADPLGSLVERLVWVFLGRIAHLAVPPPRGRAA